MNQPTEPSVCKDPTTGKPDVTYQEEDIAVFPYRLPVAMVEGGYIEAPKTQQ